MFTAIIRNQKDSIVLDNLNVLKIGHRVIYAEFEQDEQSKIRAYGRKEFDALDILEDGSTVAVYPLKGDLFRRQEFAFNPIEPVADAPEPLDNPAESAETA